MAVYTVQFMPSMKQVPRIENEFERLMNVFQETGSPIFFSDLKDAVRHIGQSTRSAFLILEDRFEAPPFGSGQAVLDDGVLILRKGFGDDYDYSDDYYRNAPVPLVLHASISKMPSGVFQQSGHLAVWLRGYRGHRVPRKVFGSMTYTPANYYVKPYALWF
jgi:hypothetical protein